MKQSNDTYEVHHSAFRQLFHSSFLLALVTEHIAQMSASLHHDLTVLARSRDSPTTRLHQLILSAPGLLASSVFRSPGASTIHTAPPASTQTATMPPPTHPHPFHSLPGASFSEHGPAASEFRLQRLHLPPIVEQLSDTYDTIERYI